MFLSRFGRRSRPTPGITRRPERLKVNDKRRVGGRVHAHVRLHPPLAHLSPPALRRATFNPHHASRHRPALRPSHPCWPATLETGRCITRRSRALIQQNPSDRNSNLTPGITRRATPLLLITAAVSAVGCMPMLDRLRAAGCNFRVGSPPRSGDLTPRITRPPAPLIEFNSRRVAGRVHALVRPPNSGGVQLPRAR